MSKAPYQKELPKRQNAATQFALILGLSSTHPNVNVEAPITDRIKRGCIYVGGVMAGNRLACEYIGACSKENAIGS